LEAAAVEVPAVAYDVGGVAEVVRSGLTGLLVARDDVDGFAAAVLQLLGAEMTRREMGGNARQYVLEHHSLSTSAARFEDLYRQLLIKAAR
jgi:glycosyltransferase involved in cell wall biosynthesis